MKGNTMTATEAMLKRDDDERDNNILNQCIRHFIKTYEPEDRRDRLDFEMALHDLVRQVYREASKPYEKIMTNAVQSMSLQSIIHKDKP